MAQPARKSRRRRPRSEAAPRPLSQAIDRMRARLKLREREAPEFYAALAKQVTAQRSARGLSQRELAELCGTTQSAIARLERGLRPPRMDTLLRVAWALDCNLDVELNPRTKTKGSDAVATQKETRSHART
jgi:ribosome-binding protein aMBF1 (putative translation factor)